jgi:hypothetical protein
MIIKSSQQSFAYDYLDLSCASVTQKNDVLKRRRKAGEATKEDAFPTDNKNTLCGIIDPESGGPQWHLVSML